MRKTVKNKSLPSITGVGKLQPKDQIQPIASFGTAHELRMVFTFLGGYKIKKRSHDAWTVNEVQISMSTDQVC